MNSCEKSMRLYLLSEGTGAGLASSIRWGCISCVYVYVCVCICVRVCACACVCVHHVGG